MAKIIKKYPAPGVENRHRHHISYRGVHGGCAASEAGKDKQINRRLPR